MLRPIPNFKGVAVVVKKSDWLVVNVQKWEFIFILEQLNLIPAHLITYIGPHFNYKKGHCVTSLRDTDQMKNINTKFNDRAKNSKG